MKKLVLVRIDDRLIHGQIATQWLKEVKGNEVLIVDDDLPNDAMMTRICKAVAPPGVSVEIQSVDEATEYIRNGSEKLNTVILVKEPSIVERLIDNGITIPTIILGGMGQKAGRAKFNKNISASEEEIDCMRRIVEKGSKILYQLVPAEKAKNIDSLL